MATNEYKGEKVMFDERTEEWVCGTIRDKSYKAVCAQIDRDFKEGFERQECFVRNPYGHNKRPLRATITSVTRDGREAWVQVEKLHGEGTERSKYAVGNLIPMNAETERIVDEIDVCEAVIKSTTDDITKLLGQLPALNL